MSEQDPCLFCLHDTHWGACPKFACYCSGKTYPTKVQNMDNSGKPYKPIWSFPEDSKIEQVTYKRLLSLSERVGNLQRELDALQRDILTWMRINADENFK